jgi:uncharacterized membrane protein
LAQALVWLTLALPLFLSTAGLAIDGGVLLTSRRELQSLADGAARAGATRLDTARLRASGGSDVELDRSLATGAALTYIQAALQSGSGFWSGPPNPQVDVAVRRVHVNVSARVHTAFLRVVHIDDVPVEASAYADVQYGIRNGSGG